MKLKVNDAGLPVQVSPVPRLTPSTDLSCSQSLANEHCLILVVLWSAFTLFLNLVLILVAISLTLCDTVDLESDSKVKLLNFPEQIEVHLTDWAPRFLITIVGFMLSVLILVLERSASYQPWDAVNSLLWFTSQILHLPEISNYFPSSELFIFKCILSATLASLSLVLLVCHSFNCLSLYLNRARRPQDVSSINPSHKELVLSFRENNEIISSPEGFGTGTSFSDSATLLDPESESALSQVSSCRSSNIQPDTTLRKRLAGLSIDKEIRVKHCTAEDETFDQLLAKLGTNLQSANKNVSLREVSQQTNWISSGFWATRCYGNEMDQKEGQDIQSRMLTSFSASWSRLIPDGSGTGIISNVTQKLIRISHEKPLEKSNFESTDSLQTKTRAVVHPSKLNLLPQLPSNNLANKTF